MSFTIGVVALVLAAVLFIGWFFSSIVSGGSVGLLLTLLMLTALIAVGIAIFLVVHKKWWKSGGAQSVALVGVALFLLQWAVIGLDTRVTWWLRMQHWGSLASAAAVPVAMAVVVGSVGLLVRAMKRDGNPAWIIGLTLAALFFVAPTVKNILTFGEGAAMRSDLTGEVKVVPFDVHITKTIVVRVPGWNEENFSPVDGSSPVGWGDLDEKAQIAQIQQWIDDGVAPGMTRKELIGRLKCNALRRDAGNSITEIPADDAAAAVAYETLSRAEEQFDCSTYGETKSTVGSLLPEEWTPMAILQWAVGGTCVAGAALIALALAVRVLGAGSGQGGNTPPAAGGGH
ncbi:MAG: hypothetical protein KIH62_003410 [Candidatus Kerfeldbacteria bacterium]|nr:hypothetical protein [Candidatus Kerfeldbacteria bacterium]